MREIKFRAKHWDTKKWIYGGVCEFVNPSNNEIHWLMIHHDKYLNPMVSRVIPETIGEFTGIKDKNGKEIYEGDIVKDSTTYPLEVYWMGLAWGFKWKNDEGECEEQIICDEDWDAEYNGNGDTFEYKEIIGNIHDNPELLK